jgi:mannose-6-phosphate isomerase
VPVQPGDFFALTPGMPHAVGRGVTLLEPQYVAQGKKGMTLRYWDWNRRYDANGKLDANGAPRELHVERALQVTRWREAGDPEFLKSMRCSIGAPVLDGPLQVVQLVGPEAGARVRSPYLRAAALRGTGEAPLPGWNVLRSLTVISGAVTLLGAFGELSVEAGRTAAIGAGLGAVKCRATRAHALLSSAVA